MQTKRQVARRQGPGLALRWRGRISTGLRLAWSLGLLLGVASECAAGECATWKPGWVFCDDFEDGTWLDTWDSSIYCCDTNKDGTISLAEREAVTSGGYNSTYAAYSVRPGESMGYDGLGYDGHFGIRAWGSDLDELYIRWYVYVSSPYVFSDGADKNLILYSDTPDGSHINPYVTLGMWGDNKPRIVIYNNSSTPCVNQATPNPFGEYVDCVNRWQNVGNDIALQPGRWYLFEWYVKLNTPGAANGIAKLWIDDASGPITTQTLRASYTDVVFRPSSFQSSWKLQYIFLSPYRQPPDPQGQHTRWDQIVVSSQPIGPMGGTLPPTVRGDLDGDGDRDLDDLRRMIYMLIGTVPKDLATADLDGDGDVDLDDLRRMIFIFVGLL